MPAAMGAKASAPIWCSSKTSGAIERRMLVHSASALGISNPCVTSITSMSVKQPIGTLILSNTARAGATGFLKTLATEVAADGVTVNSVLPGLHATDRLLDLYGGDTGNLTVGDPADFGNVVAFVCSEHARFITGSAIPVDGGVYPGLL